MMSWFYRIDGLLSCTADFSSPRLQKTQLKINWRAWGGPFHALQYISDSPQSPHRSQRLPGNWAWLENSKCFLCPHTERACKLMLSDSGDGTNLIFLLPLSSLRRDRERLWAKRERNCSVRGLCPVDDGELLGCQSDWSHCGHTDRWRTSPDSKQPVSVSHICHMVSALPRPFRVQVAAPFNHMREMDGITY